MPVSTTSSPFHRGEREIQERLGVREQLEEVGKRFIRGFMPGEHRAFYARLPFLLIGSVDNRGRPGRRSLRGALVLLRPPLPTG